MAYSELLADRIRQILDNKKLKVSVEEKRMFGGLCFMIDGKMCVGVHEERFMGRLDPEIQEEVMKRKGCREMDFTKRPMRGFVFVDPEGTDMEEDLTFWVDTCLEFNPRAKASKKKKKKK